MTYFTIGDRVLVNAGRGGLLVVKPPSLPTTPTPGAGGGGTTPTPTPTPTPAVGTITGVAITSVNGTTASYTWNNYTAAAVTEYGAELRPRGGAAGTSDTWAGIGRWAGPPGSKGGLVDGSSYELRIVAYNGATVVAVSAPVAFAVGTVSTGAGTGAGTGTSTGGGTTTPTGPTAPYAGTIEALRLTAAVPTLPVTLRVYAEEAYNQPPVCCGHAFGPGDVPSTHRVRLRTAAGLEIAVQQDGESRWPDGSLRYCVLSFVAPDAFSLGQTIPYTVDAVAGTPNRTASYTLAQVAANTDFRLKAKGFSWGTGVALLAVNDVIAANKVNSWGANPKLGIEVISSGPIMQEWLVWGVAKRESDGALHESVRLELYLRRWATTGAWETIARQRQPSLDAAFYGSTWSTTGWNKGNAGFIECYNGAAWMWSLGGPNDRDARTVPPSQFNAAEGKYNFRADQNLGQVAGLGNGDQWWAMGVAFGMSGNVPGGLSASAPYWLAGDGRVMAARNDYDSGVNFSAPGGDCTTFPLLASWPGTGVVCADEQGDAFWTGTGARPRVRVGHDLPYFTRSTRLFAPMDLAAPRPAEPATQAPQWPFHPYRPGQFVHDKWIDWGNGGDNWHEDRIGWLSRQHANLLLTPFDKVRRTHCYALAYMQNDAHWDWSDQRSGRVPCVNNGPNDSGNAYPEMSAPQPTLFMTNRDTQGIDSATPGFSALAYYNTGGSGYYMRYNPVNEASHYPNWQVVPHLLTGHRVFLDIMRTNVASIFCSSDGYKKNKTLLPPFVPAARNFRAIFHDQTRSQGWSRLALSNLRYMLPDNHVERAYFDDIMKDAADYWGFIAPYAPAKMFGVVHAMQQEGNIAGYVESNYNKDFSFWVGNIGFQSIYEAMGTLLCIYRGDAAWKPAMQVYLVGQRDLADDQRASNGTGFFTGIYFADFHDQAGNYYKTQQEFIEKSSLNQDIGPHVGPPFPNNSNWSGDQRSYGAGNATRYHTQQCALLALASWIAKPDGTPEFPGCDRVRLQLINRLAGTPGTTTLDRFELTRADRPGEMGAQWSIVGPGM